jgi:NAD(P)H dehydrogenase (quinone)
LTEAATLVVHAHPDSAGFTSAWAAASREAAAARGPVLASDLHGMGFDPVEGPGHYADPPVPFDALKAQEAAAAACALPGDVAGEVVKVEAADRLILHFPLWWFAPPAMIKGWCERVLVHGLLQDADRRFDKGPCRGKSALFCVTTGANAAESGPDGREGDTRLWLMPLAMTLRYCGFDVLEPVLEHGVHGYQRGERKAALEARLAARLAGQGALLAGWDAGPRIAFNADGDFDAAGRLREGAPSHHPFIRH